MKNICLTQKKEYSGSLVYNLTALKNYIKKDFNQNSNKKQIKNLYKNDQYYKNLINQIGKENSFCEILNADV